MRYLAKKDNSAEMAQFIKTDGECYTFIFLIEDYICEIRKQKSDLPYTIEYVNNEFKECTESDFNNALNKALETLTYELL